MRDVRPYRLVVPQLANEPVVWLAVGPQSFIDLDTVVAERLVEILVVAEQAAELLVLVGPANFLPDKPADLS